MVLAKVVNFLRYLRKNVWFLQLVAAFLPRGGPVSELLNIYSSVNILFQSCDYEYFSKTFCSYFLVCLSLLPQVSDQLEEFSG